MRGRKPRPTVAPRLRESGLPRCPDHLDAVARKEWRRLARPLIDAGILTVAAYCQSYSQWVEAVQKMADTPKLIRTRSGYVQQSPWTSIANKQLELMGRYMTELGLTPVARTWVDLDEETAGAQVQTVIRVIYGSPDGTTRDARGNRVEADETAMTIDGNL